MDIWIGFVVAALKAGVSGVVGNEIVQALVDQGIDIGSDKFSQYLEKTQKELSYVLTDKSLMKMNVPKDYFSYVQEEITELLRSISLEEDLFRNCCYDAKSLAEVLYKKYKEQKKDFVEYESEIQKVLYVMSEKAISLEKEREGFSADSLVHIINNQEEQMELIRKIWVILDKSMKNNTTYLKKEQNQEQNNRLPGRTEEYSRKWNENILLNNFIVQHKLDYLKDREDVEIKVQKCRLLREYFEKLKEAEEKFKYNGKPEFTFGCLREIYLLSLNKMEFLENEHYSHRYLFLKSENDFIENEIKKVHDMINEYLHSHSPETEQIEGAVKFMDDISLLIREVYQEYIDILESELRDLLKIGDGVD